MQNRTLVPFVPVLLTSIMLAGCGKKPDPPPVSASPTTVKAAIGRALTVEGTVYALDSNKARRGLSKDSDIFFKEKIVTEADSRIYIALTDGTRLSQGENAEMVIDEYVYDPSNVANAAFNASMRKGAFRLVTGKITQLDPDRFKVKTRMATIGIRGTEVYFLLTPEEETVLVAELTKDKVVTVTTGDQDTTIDAAERQTVVRKNQELETKAATAQDLEAARRKVITDDDILTPFKAILKERGIKYAAVTLAANGLPNLDITWKGMDDLTHLKGLQINRLDNIGFGGKDISPLRGMPLTELNLKWSRFLSDISPLEGMQLTFFSCTGARESHNALVDISPLKGMPLQALDLYLSSVSDLTPLKGMPLRKLWLARSKAADLSPLRGMSLNTLSIERTPVADLSPLSGMPLAKLSLRGSKVADLTPLRDLPLEALWFTPESMTAGMDAIRRIKTLSEINGKPAAEFWKAYDADRPR